MNTDQNPDIASANHQPAPIAPPNSKIVVRASRVDLGRDGGKGGEGGGSRCSVSNKEFLAAIFGTLPDGARPIALAKIGDPTTGGWAGFDALEVDKRCSEIRNNYFNCSSFFPDEHGDLRATEQQAAAYHCLVLDDVGTKVPMDLLPMVEATWMLETSPSNYQVGFGLVTPVSDAAAVKAALKRILGAGLGDKGAGGMCRWVRLPNGVNGKPNYRRAGGKPFQCRLANWNPAIAYELGDLVKLLAPASANTPALTERDASAFPDEVLTYSGISSEVFQPARPENPVVTALKVTGLYKAETAPGRHEVTCPWVEEHTDQLDTGACFFQPSREYPLGGFKCHHSHGDRYRLKALLDRFELTRRDLHNRPRIRIVEGELQTMVDAAQVVLAATGDYFQSGGLIVKVAVDRISGVACLVPQTDADLTLALSSAADWERWDTKNGTGNWRRCNPLPNAVRLLVQSQSYSHLPVLKGIARQPMINDAGQLVSAAGYHSDSQLYCAFDPTGFARPEPTEENARAALNRLLHLVREFHFASDQDLAATLCAIFTAVLRPGLGRAPAFHARAPSPGSGKSFLTDLIALFAGPGEPAKVSYPRTDEEATKVILAALLQAPAVLDFDDMTIDWRPFGAINRLLTSATMTDRLLGSSKMATVSTDTLVLGSGNNTGPTGDLNRRVLVIDLDPREESPATLRYQDNPVAAVRANRETYVADVLLIVEAWIAAGKPRGNLCPIATYGGPWTDYCREPLVWLGLHDPAEQLIQQLKDDPDKAALGRLLQAWNGQFGERGITLRVLVADAEGELQDALEDLPCVEGSSINRSRLGRYLARNAGRPVGELRLEKAHSRERNAWRVVRLRGPSEVQASAPPSPPLPPSLDLDEPVDTPTRREFD